ncbi:MAG: class B sortase [Eubacterium sp.]|nr:class B sortase [Eubacterium sp.]
MNENELNNNELNDQNNQNEDNRKKRKIKLILIFIIVFVLVFCAVYFGIQLYNSHITKPLPATTAPVSVSQTVEESKVENPIDFEALKAQNEDIYAWIKVDDTNVDYPIVQNPTDDEFYLKHTAEDKSWSASGAVYTELVNNKNFRDAVTLIYGHNGYGDTMFTTLHRFSDEDFFNSHPYFYIYTQDRKLTYQVVSAFKYDDRHIMNSFNFANLEELEEFQNYVQNPTSSLKNVRTDLDKPINSSSKLVILSTCITNQKSSRYLICGVLTNDEKTN